VYVKEGGVTVMVAPPPPLTHTSIGNPLGLVFQKQPQIDVHKLPTKKNLITFTLHPTQTELSTLPAANNSMGFSLLAGQG